MSRTAAQSGKTVAAPAARAADASILQRQCACGNHTIAGGECEACSNERTDTLQRSAINREPISGHGNGRVPSIVHEVLRSPGQPLDATTRAFFEPRSGHDFSHVRVHTDARAAESAQAVSALAYTVGQNVVFGSGAYLPQTSQGRSLLAHELTHVIQQRSAASVGGELALGSPETTFEREADATAQSLLIGPPHAQPEQSVARQVLQRAGFGEVHLAEARDEAEAKLPAKFPDAGIRIIGPDSSALVKILSDCTGLPLSIGAGQMLAQTAGQAAGPAASATAKSKLSTFISASPGVIIDTEPTAAAVVVGVFGMMTPGYQQIDVGNVQVLAGASGARGGAKGGLSACDAVMHEITEAEAGRQASQKATGNVGGTAFQPAHAEGLKVESDIRKELGLPLRSASAQGDMALLDQEGPTKPIVLESTMYGEGKDLVTQINVLRIVLPAVGAEAGDDQVVASTVVKGEVHFKTQMEAIAVFNRYASQLGLEKITVPAPAKKK